MTTITFASPTNWEAFGPYQVTDSDPESLYPFRDRVTADGSSGYPATPGRYLMYQCFGCPFAHPSAIVRKLMGLEEVIAVAYVDATRDSRGWAFRELHGPDSVNGFAFLRDAYNMTVPDYEGHISVPALWDREASRIVNNDFVDILVDVATQFDAWATNSLDLYPVALRPEIDELGDTIYEEVNSGTYQVGLSTNQKEYDERIDRLFARLDALEERLSSDRFLFGDQLTVADARLYPTLARFDIAYHPFFKCNVRRLTEYPNLWGYARDLYQRPAFRETTDFDSIKASYYTSFTSLNQNRIIPKGPFVDWTVPHNRG